MTTTDTLALWEQYGDALRRFIRKRVADESAADDILQNTFLRIHLKIGLLRDDDKLESWIYQIARNAVIDFYRSCRERVETELSESLSAADAADDAPACDLRPEVRRMMSDLPETYRQAILWDTQGLPQKEIAARLGLSLSGAKSRVQRAREQIKQALLDCCDFEFDRRGRVIDCWSASANKITRP